MNTELMNAIDTHSGNMVIEWATNESYDEMETIESTDSDHINYFLSDEWDSVDHWEYCGDVLIITLS